jgi:2-polyprenyl-3-methyl-5-hydroxy-6-metoxy-1,4-benzoquinol methylase
MWQTNCLTEDTLRDIYSHYRDTSFRNETLEQIFDRVDRLSPSESENHYRYHWFSNHVGGIPRTVLDIGSGFGIWPNILRKNGWKVVCTEPNQESCDFINNVLKIKCVNSFSLDDINQQFDVVSLVHVLEHIRTPKSLLEAIREILVYNGKLFVEVPDQTEFSTLDINNDEFNSTHLWFFDVTSLYTLLSKSFRVTDIHRVHYESRGLYRILALCQNIG